MLISWNRPPIYQALILMLLITTELAAQDIIQFPSETIDTAIINRRDLGDQIKMLETECNWSERVGEKIDVFWIRGQDGDLFGHSYEYFLACDNLRLIYWYNNPAGKGRPVDFMIENLEDESDFVIAKRKHLKNKRKYQSRLE